MWCYPPAIDINYFQDTNSSYYWSSSISASYIDDAWSVYFLYGEDYDGDKGNSSYVRAVRNIQSDIGSLDNLVISVSPASRTVDNSAGNITFDVSNTGTGTMAWSAFVTLGSDWLSIESGSSGSNSGTITLNYTKNTATATRTGTITVTATGATNNPKTATVTQVGGVKETITITPSSPDATVSASSGFVQLFGASGASNITIEAGATAKLINFPGSNTITIKGDSTSFKISRSGAMVKFEGSDGTLVQMPATKTAQTIIFNDVSAKLVIENNKVMFGTQVVTLTSEKITGAGETLIFTNDFSSIDDLTGWEFTLPWNSTYKTTDYTLENGYVELKMLQTDKGGNVLSPKFLVEGDIRVTVTHYMHKASSVYLGGIGLTDETSIPTSTEKSNSIHIGFQNSYYSPDYACSAYDIPVFADSLGCIPKNFQSSVTSSSLYDKWITTIINYSPNTGNLTVDYDNDGIIDFDGTITEDGRFTPTRIYFGTFGWYTGHFHRIDKVEIYRDIVY